MRIGIDIRTLQGSQANRGVGRYTRNLLISLAGSAECCFILFARSEMPAPDLSGLPSVEKRTERIELVSTPPIAPYLRFFRFARLRRLYQTGMYRRHQATLSRAVRRTRPDILHFPSLTEDDFFADAGRVCPTIATLHDLIPLILRSNYLDSWMDSTREVYLRQIAGFAQADAVAAVSQSAKDDGLRLLNLKPERVRVVPPAILIPSPLSQENAQRIATKYGLTGPFFLYSSGAGPNKNLPRILAAYDAYARISPKPLPLALAGAMPPAITDLIETLSASSKNSCVPRLLGFVPDDDLAALQSCARAVIVVSRYEGFGLPVAEALARGTTVLAGNNSSLPEVVGDKGLLVDADSTSAIADGFGRLAENVDLCREWGRRGPARVATLFGPQVQREALFSLYAEVIQKR